MKPSPPFLQGALGKPLTTRQRQTIADDVRALLRWQETLKGWRPAKSAVPGVPFVALYAQGALRACMGSGEGPYAERLTRAFLSALGDTRFGGVGEATREDLVAEVSFVRSPRKVSPDALAAFFETGVHGVGLLRETKAPVFLLPSVARDARLDAAGMVAALERKSGVNVSDGELFAFETETVVVRRRTPKGPVLSDVDAGAKWLAGLILPEGQVSFSVEARSGERTLVGEMNHARAAAVLHALRAHGGSRAKLARADAWLAAEVRRASAGKEVPGWPTDPARVAATLALAARAGVKAVLPEAVASAHAQSARLAQVPWHAAQVVALLGTEAPAPLWEACLRDLEPHPWAPWTALAAHARGDTQALARAARALVDAVRPEGSAYAGAVTITRTPEVAVTALTVEALRAVLGRGRDPKVAAAIARGSRFLKACQLTRGSVPGPYVPEAEGAFCAAPGSSLLRGDVTGHAVLALLG